MQLLEEMEPTSPSKMSKTLRTLPHNLKMHFQQNDEDIENEVDDKENNINFHEGIIEIKIKISSFDESATNGT